jgi:hypothetical protein
MLSVAAASWRVAVSVTTMVRTRDLHAAQQIRIDLVAEREMQNPTLIVLTDRNDLATTQA